MRARWRDQARHATAQALRRAAHALGGRSAALVPDWKPPAHEVSALALFAQECARLRDRVELYRQVTSHTACAVRAGVSFLLLYEKASNEMVSQAPGYGVDGDALKAIRYPVTPDLRAAWDFRTQGPLLCNDPQSDHRVVRDLVRTLELDNLVVGPLCFQGRVTGLIAVANKPGGFTEHDARIVNVLSHHASLAVSAVRCLDELQQRSIRDSLTGLYSYRYFRAHLDVEAYQARRAGSRLALLMVDIDDFKAYNSWYGYSKGDAILKDAAVLVTRHTRRVDVVARPSGDEFAIVLAGAGPEQARAVAERLRTAFDEHPFGLASGELPKSLTISIGAATSAGTTTADRLIAQAEHALSRAKSEGKNRVIVPAASYS